MNPFAATFEELSSDLRSHGVSIDIPGFCDSDAFLRVEQSLHPEYLNNYAAFVSRQNYDADYLAHAATTIQTVASVLHAELVDHGRLGACVDISGILGRMLEREGVWSCSIKGSLTITFPAASALETKYFWSIDKGEFSAAHAWVFAPPFTVIDITVKQQNFSSAEQHYLPETVFSRSTTPTDVEANDYISPIVRRAMSARGIPADHQLLHCLPHFPDIFNCFPAITQQGAKGSRLKYSPSAVHAPDGTFEEMSNMTFNGLTPDELYIEKVRLLA